MKTVLGIDLGTQSLKLQFYDYEQGRTAAAVSAPLEVDRDAHGKAEQLAAWWLAALDEGFARVDADIKHSVQAIGVSGQQHGFVPLDGGGQVLAPVKLWCDTATQEEVELITRNCGGRERCISLAGNPMLAGYTAPKILWLKHHHPELYARLAHILLPHDYLNYLLSDTLAMEYGDASGTGLLDIRRRLWSADLLQAVDVERDLKSCLPPLHAHDAFIGRTSLAAAERWGLRTGVPVAPGGGDNMMGAIGTGNVVAGELSISLGSSGTLYTCSDTPIVDPDGTIAAFCSSSGGWLPLLCTMNCTLATERMRALLDIPLRDFDALTDSVRPGADGLVVLPFFNGERTPDLPHGKACVLGMDISNATRAHLLRATMEATCFGLLNGLNILCALGLQSEAITLTGGGSRSKVWRQCIADLFGMPVRILAEEEGACFGAALQALWLLQKETRPGLTLQQLCGEHVRFDTEHSCAPQEAMTGPYREAYTQYQRVLHHVAPLYKPLSNDRMTEY